MAETLDVPDPAATLYRYLLDRSQIEGIEDYNPDLLSIRSDEIRAAICAGGNWEHQVMPAVVELITKRRFFGCPGD